MKNGSFYIFSRPFFQKYFQLFLLLAPSFVIPIPKFTLQNNMKVYLAWSPEATEAANLLPSNEGRQLLVDRLIEMYGLLDLAEVFDVEPADSQDLRLFHSDEYVEELLRQENAEDDSKPEIKATRDKFGLSYDCPVFQGLSSYVLQVAGSSLSAADLLIQKKALGDKDQNVVINWYGGRHHCGRDRASGFCYVNDIVLAILRLRTRYRRIFYLDLDLHHGDGVENAFRHSKNVTTCSIHRHGVGFFPGTGAVSTTGTYNVPTERGLGDANFHLILRDYILPLLQKIAPEVVVIQCGADGLASDPHGEWNLTIPGFTKAVADVIENNPCSHVLLLGGGGYNNRDTARLWCHITKTVLGVNEEWTEIPQHSDLELFAEDHYQFWTEQVLHSKPGRLDENKDILSKLSLD